MFDIGGLELLVVAAVALIVVGPKELPVLVRNVGRWVSRARQMAREFQQGMEDAAKEADVDELRQIGAMKQDLEKQARDFGRSAQSVLDDVDRDKASDKPARRAPSAPRAPERTPRAPERRAADDRLEPEFDRRESDYAPRGSGYAERPARPRQDRAPQDRTPQDRLSQDRASDERGADSDDALDRFQRGMRRGE